MPAPDPLYVPYGQYTAAHFWGLFAAHALAGLNALGNSDGDPEFNNDECVRHATTQADSMLAEFRARFHHEAP